MCLYRFRVFNFLLKLLLRFFRRFLHQFFLWCHFRHLSSTRNRGSVWDRAWVLFDLLNFLDFKCLNFAGLTFFGHWLTSWLQRGTFLPDTELWDYFLNFCRWKPGNWILTRHCWWLTLSRKLLAVLEQLFWIRFALYISRTCQGCRSFCSRWFRGVQVRLYFLTNNILNGFGQKEQFSLRESQNLACFAFDLYFLPDLI